MFDELDAILARVAADYADIRDELKRQVLIGYVNGELKAVASDSTDGFVLRVLKDGGLASAAFTDPAEAERIIRTCQENARLIGRHARIPTRLAPTEVIRDTFYPPLDVDPRQVTIDEKRELVRHYHGISFNRPGIASATAGYFKETREKHFASTEGSRIREDLVFARVNGFLVSQDGTLTQQVWLGASSSDGFARLRHREELFETRTRLVLDLLKARPVGGGSHRVVLNPDVTAVFVHEAFGHYSEADMLEDIPTMRAKMQLGARLGNEVLSITDDATRPAQIGFRRYDDEGVRVRPVALMAQGVLCGRLHSRRTAAAFGEPLSGHCIAEDYRFAPIVRMGCIFVEPGPDSLDTLLARLGDGLYLLDTKGGETYGDSFAFGAQYGYEVKGGRRGALVRDINVSGNLYATLRNISAVGNDLTIPEVGGCGKGNQGNYRSAAGGPHILIDQVVIGGN